MDLLKRELLRLCAVLSAWLLLLRRGCGREKKKRFALITGLDGMDWEGGEKIADWLRGLTIFLFLLVRFVLIGRIMC